MKRFWKFTLFALFLLVVLSPLYACSPAPSEDQISLDIEPFIQMAKNAPCADLRNQLFVIDDQFVFWTTQGQCEDASYSHTLFGSTPDEKLCFLEDSFVAPRSSCEPELDEIFETILQNLDQPDLGLEDNHVVIEIKLE
jgi:hypothetical protein